MDWETPALNLEPEQSSLAQLAAPERSLGALVLLLAVGQEALRSDVEPLPTSKDSE